MQQINKLIEKIEQNQRETTKQYNNLSNQIKQLTASIEHQQGEIMSNKIKQQNQLNTFSTIYNPYNQINYHTIHTTKTKPKQTIRILKEPDPTKELTIHNIPNGKDENITTIINNIIKHKNYYQTK